MTRQSLSAGLGTDGQGRVVPATTSVCVPASPPVPPGPRGQSLAAWPTGPAHLLAEPRLQELLDRVLARDWGPRGGTGMLSLGMSWWSRHTQMALAFPREVSPKSQGSVGSSAVVRQSVHYPWSPCGVGKTNRAWCHRDPLGQPCAVHILSQGRGSPLLPAP